MILCRTFFWWAHCVSKFQKLWQVQDSWYFRCRDFFAWIWWLELLMSSIKSTVRVVTGKIQLSTHLLRKLSMFKYMIRYTLRHHLQLLTLLLNGNESIGTSHYQMSSILIKVHRQIQNNNQILKMISKMFPTVFFNSLYSFICWICIWK